MMLVLGRFLFFLFSFRFTLFLLFRFVAVFFIPIHVFTNCLCTLYQCNLRISATNIKENRHTIKIKERIVTPERTDARFIYAAWNDFPRKNNYLFVCCFTIAAQSLCLFVEVWWLIGIEFAYDRTFSVFFFAFSSPLARSSIAGYILPFGRLFSLLLHFDLGVVFHFRFFLLVWTLCSAHVRTSFCPCTLHHHHRHQRRLLRSHVWMW